MFSPVTFGRIAQKQLIEYRTNNNLCLKCGGSLKSCHNKKEQKE